MDRTLLGLMFFEQFLQSLLPKIPSLHTSRAEDKIMHHFIEAPGRAEPNRDGQAKAVLFLLQDFNGEQIGVCFLEKRSETSSLHSDIRWNRRGKLGQQVIEKGITYRKTGSLCRSGNLEQIVIGYGKLKINIELPDCLRASRFPQGASTFPG
jgi:hypothetical protein